jgi:hypothetical protein
LDPEDTDAANNVRSIEITLKSLESTLNEYRESVAKLVLPEVKADLQKLQDEIGTKESNLKTNQYYIVLVKLDSKLATLETAKAEYAQAVTKVNELLEEGNALFLKNGSNDSRFKRLS